ncbi:hypothetical protein CBS101457_005021 [Exobasidium rhododendri]|nr:hypothetical protein CBS101457_005021 [Exobasidium rhododendri]
MHPFTLVALVPFILSLCGFTLATTVTVDSVSCSQVDWSITLAPADYNAADYAQLIVGNDADANDFVTSQTLMISATGDINAPNVPFDFFTTLSTHPGGSVWDVDFVLLDANQNLIPSETLFFYYDNPCISSVTATSALSSVVGASTIVPSTSSSSIRVTSTSPAAASTAPVTTPTPISTPTPTPTPTPPPSSKISVPAIAGGVAGGIALLLAAFIFCFLRRRKARDQVNKDHQYNNNNSLEQGGRSRGMMPIVSVLPHSHSYGAQSEEIGKESYYEEPRTPSATTFSSPPTSPNMSAMGRPPSTMSASTRGNNPLLNRQHINNSGWNSSPPLAEPM